MRKSFGMPRIIIFLLWLWLRLPHLWRKIFKSIFIFFAFQNLRLELFLEGIYFTTHRGNNFAHFFNFSFLEFCFFFQRVICFESFFQLIQQSIVFGWVYTPLLFFDGLFRTILISSEVWRYLLMSFSTLFI